MEWDYSILDRSGYSIARVSKELFHMTDTYVFFTIFFLNNPMLPPHLRIITVTRSTINFWNIFLHRLPVQTSAHPMHFLDPAHQ